MSKRVAKQVIVMRKDLNMRKGKMIAQGAHASLAAVWIIENEIAENMISPERLEAYQSWRAGLFTKICVSVNSESALHDIAEKARLAGLPFAVITDSGATEFHGVPTKTCLAIGPAWSDEIDKITSTLPLL